MTYSRIPLVLAVVLLTAINGQASEPLHVEPPMLLLDGVLARAQLLVRMGGTLIDDKPDLTHQAKYESSRPEVAAVGPSGQVVAMGDGEATITVTANGSVRVVPVRVQGAGPRAVVGFNEQIEPILSKAGCNGGACHASQYGKGGFKLSIFADDPRADQRAIVRDALGRRVNFLSPANSLLLLKPSGKAPHGGGLRLDGRSIDFRVLKKWIAAGAQGPAAGDRSKVTNLEISPARRLATGDFSQQLRVVAIYSDGARRDVTHWAHYDSLDEGVLRVTPQGQMRVFGRGQGAAMARFEGQAAVAQVVVPFGPTPRLDGWTENHFIDALAAAKFRQLGLTPAPVCDDGAFLRRAFLDAIGTTPTVAEARQFLDSKDPDKRRKLVDRLLGLSPYPVENVHNNAYGAYWGLRWADLLRSRNQIGEQLMWVLHNWLQESFRDNKRMDVFVRELLTARGSMNTNGPANFFATFNNNEMRTEAVAQVFLGVRVQCAQCHHHPFEAISQADYYRLAAYFARVGTKGLQDSGVRHYSSEVITLPKGEIQHPRTGEVMQPAPLHGGASVVSGERRVALARWITAPDNPYFARNIVNRYWAHCMGRGLIDPVDDIRLTNPASNPELLDALAREFVRTGFDAKQLLRTIMTSRLYQLDSTPIKSRYPTERFYASFRPKRVSAEALSDAVDAATGVVTQFKGVPLGTRAIELPDAIYDDPLLATFGKPKREGVCECERSSEPNLAQALHTLNSSRIFAKIGDPKGRLAKLLAGKAPHESIVEELYLATLSRRPTRAEQEACRRFVAAAPNARNFYEDLLWSLINSKQFLFVH